MHYQLSRVGKFQENIITGSEYYTRLYSKNSLFYNDAYIYVCLFVDLIVGKLIELKSKTDDDTIFHRMYLHITGQFRDVSTVEL